MAEEALSWRKRTWNHRAEEAEVHDHCYGALQKIAHVVVEEQARWSLQREEPTMASLEAMQGASNQRLTTVMRSAHSMVASESQSRPT